MSERHAVTLPGGLWRDGARHQRASVRALTGADEEFLAEAAAGLPAAVRVTALLARCVYGLGEGEAAAAMRELAAGDREALLLHLRRATFGDRMQCVIGCPHCREPMDVELAVADLLVPPYDHHAPRATAELDGVAVELRLPTGAELEDAAHAPSPEAGAERLLQACVSPAGGELRAELAAAAEERLADLDPQAELRLELTCPECDAAFSAVLDAAHYLFAEVAQRAAVLHREVHALAWHYHWAEADILAMTAPKRRRYLELVAEELSGSGAP